MYIILNVLSAIFGLAVRFRNFLYDYKIISCSKFIPKVISVGNINSGGTGKTPAVIALAKYFLDGNFKVTVVTRGYKSKLEKDGIIIKAGSADEFSPQDIGDEAYMIRSEIGNRVHIVIGKKRTENIAKLLKTDSTDYIILDDAFQHRKIARDANIVMINCTQNPFNDRLLPSGQLREPVSSLSRADLVILTRENLVSSETVSSIKNRIRSIKNMDIISSSFTPEALTRLDGVNIPLESLHGQRVTVLTAIASPDGFISTISQLGAIVEKRFLFPDHHKFREHELSDILNKSAQLPIICTHKDAGKIREATMKHNNFAWLRISLRFKMVRHPGLEPGAR